MTRREFSVKFNVVNIVCQEDVVFVDGELPGRLQQASNLMRQVPPSASMSLVTTRSAAVYHRMSSYQGVVKVREEAMTR